MINVKEWRFIIRQYSIDEPIKYLKAPTHDHAFRTDCMKQASLTYCMTVCVRKFDELFQVNLAWTQSGVPDMFQLYCMQKGSCVCALKQNCQIFFMMNFNWLINWVYWRIINLHSSTIIMPDYMVILVVDFAWRYKSVYDL